MNNNNCNMHRYVDDYLYLENEWVLTEFKNNSDLGKFITSTNFFIKIN